MTKNDMIISLLKHGRSEEVRLHIKELEKESYTEDFCSFMDQMLDEYKVKRKQVAIRSGKELQQLVLDGVGVLEFIHQYVMEALSVVVADLRVVRKELVCPKHQVVKVQ